MKLLSLTANKPSFKAVSFNESGLTLILGKKEAPHNNKKKTYNSVGKSLIVRLIHFCLGCSEIEEFEKRLPDWEFTLAFKIGNDTFSSTRKTNDQKNVLMNNTTLKLKEFNNKMAALVFGENLNSPNSFRSLISRFVRSRKSSYNRAESPIHEENPYHQCANNAFLLGLDVHLARKKHQLKKDRESTVKLKKSLVNDPVLNSFFKGGNDNVEIELEHCFKKINSLETNLSRFTVAEDYHNIQKEADDLARRISDLENDRALLEISLENISKSLKIRPDISRSKIAEIYREAKFKLNDQLSKELDEVVDFHNDLKEKRKIRLGRELTKFRQKIKENESARKTLGKRLDEVMAYLNTRKALEEFVSLSNKLSDLKIKAQKLEHYKKLIRQYDMKNIELKAEFSQSHVDTQTYLDDNIGTINLNKRLFTDLASEFYEDKPCGIVIRNNEGDNQTRFDIIPKIHSDSGDGVNEVKIFCYDFMLLQNKSNHSIQFIFHDSRIFSDMDPRQREIAFRTAHEITRKTDAQYIATVNQDQLEPLKQTMPNREYQEIILNNIQLELTDKNSESKLLGIEVDLAD